MYKKYYLFFYSIALILGIALFYLGCETGVDVSPSPGILRVTLQSDPADTSIIVLKDTFAVSENDWFGVLITQGKVFNGENFALLFKNTKSYLVEDIVYNILDRENNEYKTFTIYESNVPPDHYDKLQFGVKAEVMRLGYFGIPVQLPAGASLLVDLPSDFDVFENKTTEVNIQISPFKSVVRYRDTYYFTREMMITGINYY